MASLEPSVKRWQESKPYKFPHEINPETLEGVVRLQVTKPFPEEWSVVGGDILFNLRSALDHLAFTIATRFKGAPLNDAEAKKCYFPIFGERPPKTAEVKELVARFGQDAWDALEKLQPCNHRQYSNDTLWALHTVHNVDKHRTLHVILPYHPGLDTHLRAGVNTTISWARPTPGYKKNGDELVAFKIHPLDPQKAGDVYFETSLLECFDIALPPGNSLPVYQGLKRMFDHISINVIPVLEPFL